MVSFVNPDALLEVLLNIKNETVSKVAADARLKLERVAEELRESNYDNV